MLAAVGVACTQRAEACQWCLSAFPFLPQQPNGETSISAVSCGGHFAETCALCTAGGSGEQWCNGQCLWLWDECIRPTFWDRVTKFVVDLFVYWYRLIPYMVFFGLVMLAYACAYKHKILWKLPKRKIPEHGLDFEDWKDREVGLFECCGKPSTCLWATFCTPVLAAKNHDVAGVMSYWPSCCFHFFGMYTLFLPFYCLMVVVRQSFSSSLKRNLSFESNPCKDFFTTLFCFCCEVGRESIEVDNEIGRNIECLWEVSKD